VSANSAEVWRQVQVIERYLTGVRGGIPLAAEQIALLLRVVSAAVPRVERVLDLGCGDGVLGRAVAGQWPEAQVAFLDFAEPMLEACRRSLGADASRHILRLCDYGHPGWVEVVADAAPFDAVVSGFSIHHQEDARKQGLYSEIFGLLRPGGIFLNLEHVASVSDWGERVFDEYFLDGLVAYHQGLNTGKSRHSVATEYYDRADKAANRLAPVEEQCGWLRSIGFERVDCFFKVLELALFGGIRPAEAGGHP
jgi:tRNA (cmo5U34)-methyltransferase